MEENTSFEVGDVVVLKSGGPIMTIVGICGPNNCSSGDSVATCKWMNDHHNVISHNFPSSCLTKEFKTRNQDGGLLSITNIALAKKN